MSFQSDPDTPRTLYVGVVGVVLVFVAIIALQALFYHVQESEVARKSGAGAPEELAALRAEQLELLNNYRWIDRNKGTVAIPIERAMELMVSELATDMTRYPTSEQKSNK